MQDERKTKIQLIRELQAMRQQVAASQADPESRLPSVEETYHFLVEHAGYAMLILQDSQIVYWNPACTQLLGYRWDDSRQTPRDFAAYLAPEERQRVLAYYQQRLRGEAVSHWFETVILVKGGHRLAVELHPRGIVYRGDPAVMIVLREKTEQERAAVALHESEESYRRLVELCPDAIAVYCEGTMVFCNMAGAKLFGAVNPKQLLGLSVLALVPPDNLELVQWRLQRAQEVGSTEWLEQKIVRLDGHVLDVEVIWMATVYRRKPAVQMMIRDITARKAAEAVTRQAEQALRHSQEQFRRFASRLQARQEEERTRLAREIHDELAQMLTVLHMDLAWLHKRLQTSPVAWRVRIQAMTTLLTALLSAMRRIGTNLRPSILDDLGLCAAIEWHLQEVQQRTGLAYTLMLPPADVALQPAQATAVFRIFQEAIANVLCHAGASTVAVQVAEHGQALSVTIRDDGRGITMAQLADQASLGLLSMRERAQLYGGEVTIAGVAGEGTTVTIRIPIITVGQEEGQ